MPMPKSDMPSGALVLLILRVLRSGPLHGYAIAQRIHTLSSDALRVEEGSLYPALQKILLKGWVTAAWGTSETNRKVRFYKITRSGAGAALLAAKALLAETCPEHADIGVALFSALERIGVDDAAMALHAWTHGAPRGG